MICKLNPLRYFSETYYTTIASEKLSLIMIPFIIATHNGISIFDTHTNKKYHPLFRTDRFTENVCDNHPIRLPKNNYGLLFRINYFATTCSINHGSIFVFANRRTV